MKILVISQYYFPEQFRVNDVCEALARRGHQVTVLTGLPNYPDGEIYDGYKDLSHRKEYINGVQIYRCQLRPRHSGTVNLILNYLSFVFQAIKTLQTIQNQFDLIYVYEISPITAAIPAIYYKRKNSIPLYLYCLDIWPECVRDRAENKPMSKHNPVFLFSKAISKYVYKHSDMIGVKCKQFCDYLHQECGVQKKKMKVLFEHAELSYLDVLEKPQENAFYDFMFLGNLGMSQRCISLIKAVEGLKTSIPFKLHFVGSGSNEKELLEYVDQHHLDEIVKFHGHHPVSEINQFYNYADCCLLNLTCKTAVGYTLPAKLTSYMAASRPIIAAAEGATKEIIEDAKCGICVMPDDVEGLRNAMYYVLNNQEEMQKKGCNGRSYFKRHFTIQQHINELEKQFELLIVNFIHRKRN